MSKVNIDSLVAENYNRVFASSIDIEITKPCEIQNGIIEINEKDRINYAKIFDDTRTKVKLFIPASGSGSRMFEFLYDEYGNCKENDTLVSSFFSSIESMAIWHVIPEKIKLSFRENGKFQTLLNYLISESELNYRLLPKGLFPFHKYKDLVLNPFQEHVIQGLQLGVNLKGIHFTIQSNFQAIINSSINNVLNLDKSFPIEFSEQNSNTDAVVFLSDGQVATNNYGHILRRPSGHGALLSNLSRLDDDFILIKNIDNVQHQTKAQDTILYWKFLCGLLMEIKTKAKAIFNSPSLQDLKHFNDAYQIYHDEEINSIKNNDGVRSLLNRPFRVCGMVKNEGQPGGGPFWTRNQFGYSKQIVERSQINNSVNQIELFNKSTHFNPVMMVISMYDFTGKKFDLSKYSDDSSYIIVNKSDAGKKIVFAELPGLWNGAMAKWNSTFVQISNKVFTPVKSVLDLLNESHQE
jgi:hypothetical protein